MSRQYKFAITALSLILLMSTYYVVSKRFPLLPGYHAFHFTVRKYKMAVIKNEQNFKQQSIDNQQSNQVLTLHFNRLLPFWLGTRYGFYGKTQNPGEGKIACGYFVATILQDLGFELSRDEMAQAASEVMIKKIVDKKLIWRYNNLTVNDFLGEVTKHEAGIYLVGLDTHTGFLVIDASGKWFIHASGRVPFAVVKEQAATSVVLAKSKYRVVGKISDDKALLARRYGHL